MVERIRHENSHWHDRGNGTVHTCSPAGEVAGKKITIVAVLRPPLFLDFLC